MIRRQRGSGSATGSGHTLSVYTASSKTATSFIRNTKMDKCKFCEALNSYKRSNKITNREIDPEFGRWMQELTVAIVSRTWYEKRAKRHASRSVGFRRQGIGWTLNYCPECGRRLTRTKKGSIDRAMSELRNRYEDAKTDSTIINPVAYALYHTWRRFFENC